MPLTVHPLHNVGEGEDAVVILAIEEESGLDAIPGQDVQKIARIDVWTIIESQSNGTRDRAAVDDSSDRHCSLCQTSCLCGAAAWIRDR